jgi:hypothetical protein
LTEADFIAFLDEARLEKAKFPNLWWIEGIGLVWGRREADGSITLRDELPLPSSATP